MDLKLSIINTATTVSFTATTAEYEANNRNNYCSKQREGSEDYHRNFIVHDLQKNNYEGKA